MTEPSMAEQAKNRLFGDHTTNDPGASPTLLGMDVGPYVRFIRCHVSIRFLNTTIEPSQYPAAKYMESGEKLKLVILSVSRYSVQNTSGLMKNCINDLATFF
jgi:hypothetical protein